MSKYEIEFNNYLIYFIIRLSNSWKKNRFDRYFSLGIYFFFIIKSLKQKIRPFLDRKADFFAFCFGLPARPFPFVRHQSHFQISNYCRFRCYAFSTSNTSRLRFATSIVTAISRRYYNIHVFHRFCYFPFASTSLVSTKHGMISRFSPTHFRFRIPVSQSRHLIFIQWFFKHPPACADHNIRVMKWKNWTQPRRIIVAKINTAVKMLYLNVRMCAVVRGWPLHLTANSSESNSVLIDFQ